MPSPAVVIEIAAADAASPYAPALVGACSEGLRSGGACALGAAKDEPSPAVAVVAWGDDRHLGVRVEVGVNRGARSEWLTRQVAFRPSDAEDERWRAVGLVIATLVGEIAPPPAAATVTLPASPTAPPPPVAAEPAPIAPPFSARPGRWCFDLGFDLARGASDSLGARGASVRASYRLGETVLFATSSLRYEAEPGVSGVVDLAWGWATLGVGATAILPGRRLLLDLRLEPMIGVVDASLDSESTNARHVVFGVREGIALTWWLGDAVGLAIGAEAYETTGRVTVRRAPVGGAREALSTEQPLGWSGVLSLRFRLE